MGQKWIKPLNKNFDHIVERAPPDVVENSQIEKAILLFFGFHDQPCIFSLLPKEIFTIIVALLVGSQTLVGHVYQNWAIGGLVFSIKAKYSVCLTGISVVTRTQGEYFFETRRAKGEWRDNEGIRSDSLIMRSHPFRRLEDWKVVSSRRKVFFSHPEPTTVWKGQYSLKAGESVSWMINNYRSEVNGEICGANVGHGAEIYDDFIEVSPVAFLDRQMEHHLYGGSYMSVGFIGKIHYDFCYGGSDYDCVIDQIIDPADANVRIC